ncbi:hypothetical protein VM1G_11655 [Cytospora mali]|uniref:Uncharacterized protein n=1 Tax=Cytospora mali TaxID=578113 RepID=A0A194W2P5_CYTMA|nr:hypothetical protein VM1G_11655 [Valsa mali]
MFLFRDDGCILQESIAGTEELSHRIADKIPKTITQTYTCKAKLALDFCVGCVCEDGHPRQVWVRPGEPAYAEAVMPAETLEACVLWSEMARGYKVSQSATVPRERRRSFGRLPQDINLVWYRPDYVEGSIEPLLEQLVAYTYQRVLKSPSVSLSSLM